MTTLTRPSPKDHVLASGKTDEGPILSNTRAPWISSRVPVSQTESPTDRFGAVARATMTAVEPMI